MKILIYSEALADKSLGAIHSEANSVWETCKGLSRFLDITILTKKNYIREDIPKNIEIFKYTELKLLKKLFSRRFYLVHQLHQFALSPLYFLTYSPIPRLISGDMIRSPNPYDWINYKLKKLRPNKLLFEKLICQLLDIKRIPKNFEGIICRQKILYNALKILNYNPNKLYYIPFGVDKKIFNPKVETGFKYDNSILYIGKIVENKGVLDLLKAFKIVQKEIPSANLVIIGTPKKDQTFLVDKIDELINKGYKIHYLGFIENNFLPKYYKAADIFCAPAYFEPFGRVNLEAMACGTPPVSTNVGGPPDYITNMKNGLLVNPGNPKELAENLIFLLKNEELRKKLGENARKIVEKEFSWNRISKKILKIYKKY
jgi:glycosyltransferase involved in cell wall biosynthesis